MAPSSNDDGAANYRPRHPERTALYQLIERAGESYRYCHEERFEPKDGVLRKEADTAIDAFLECGRLQNGFVRIRCPACRVKARLTGPTLSSAKGTRLPSWDNHPWCRANSAHGL